MPYKDSARTKECRKAFLTKHGGQYAYNRDMSYRRNYGITLDDFNALAEQQHFKCAICGKIPDPNAKWNQKVLHVDHDHLTGHVRGLLCSDCNRGLGLFSDNAEMLLRAAAYLTGVI